MRVVVLHEAVPDDVPPDVADLKVQGDAVEAALRCRGIESRRLDFDADLERTRENLLALQPDCVFNLVESVLGEERLQLLAPALLEKLGIPFTGAPYRAFLGAAHKPLSKRCLLGAGLPTPAWWDPMDPASWSADLGKRAIVKSAWDHGSMGLSASSIIDVPRDPENLMGQLAARASFAESFVDGREFNVSLFGGEDPRVLPPAEILFQNWPTSRPRLVDYAAKWTPGSFAYAHTHRSFDFPPADEALLARLGQLSVAVWKLFGLRGYGRVDFRVDAHGQAWILEVNLNPCLAPDAGFAAAAQRAGIAYDDAIVGILQHSMRIPAASDSSHAVAATSKGPADPSCTGG